ncbi:hypothetical protein [Lysinibacillus fusiformis]|uniref:hypothetical protein n=1 Tax=Lysinibacillus fusiformis TaxID=28031 RepID=UPI003D06C62E
MTIIRGPLPRENFQILPNATARDRRLSFRARGLLALMLSYPPDWQFNRDWLARQTDGEGVSAVRTALQELETHGYLVRRRIRVDGRFQWVQKVYVTPVDTQADQPIGGKSADGIPADDFQPSKEVSHEELHEDALRCTPDGRGDEDATSDDGSWRVEDRALFRELLGDKLRSDGSQWSKGVFETNAFYDAYRKVKKHRWPGRRIQKIADDTGLDDWLIDEGLEQI